MIFRSQRHQHKNPSRPRPLQHQLLRYHASEHLRLLRKPYQTLCHPWTPVLLFLLRQVMPTVRSLFKRDQSQLSPLSLPPRRGSQQALFAPPDPSHTPLMSVETSSAASQSSQLCFRPLHSSSAQHQRSRLLLPIRLLSWLLQLHHHHHHCRLMWVPHVLTLLLLLHPHPHSSARRARQAQAEPSLQSSLDLSTQPHNHQSP